MAGNSTSLYSTASSNGAVNSNNLTTLYPSTGGAIVPTTPYGNANVVALLAAGSDGGNTIGNISATGNITGNYFIGNGSQLTGVVVSPGTEIVNGSSNVAVGYNGNVTFGIGGSSNIAVVAPSGLYVSNVVSAVGNITGNFFIGNGSQLTGLPATYSNANVATFLADFGSNTISTTGNITGGYILGNGSQLTGLPATYGNANVAAFLPTYTGDLNPGNVAATGNVSGAFLKTTGATGNIQGANYISGNILIGTTFSATGNVTGAYFLGNGSQLTGLPATYSNANVTTLLASFGSNTISTTGNITGGNILTGGVVSATGDVTGANLITTNGYVQASSGDLRLYPAVGSNVVIQAGAGGANLSVNGNITGSNILTGGAVSATGNVTGSYILGNGSQLTGLPAGYANSNAASFLAAFGSNSISTTGNVTTGNLNVQNDAVITGNLTVNGNTIFVNSNVVTINDKFINLANNAATPTQADGGGLGIGPIAGEYATLTFNSVNNNWNTNIPLSVTGNVTGNYFVGNGSALTAITGGNVTGTVANATYALTANAATYSDQANYANTANAVAGANVSGQVGNALVAGTVYTASQPNITSVGTLTSLTATGNISTTGNVTGNYFLGNGSQLTGIVATANAGGSNTQIQYNNANVSAGNAAMTFDNTTGNVTLSNLIIGTNSVGNIAAGNAATRINTSDAFLGTTLNTAGFVPGQIVIGNGFFGNLNLNNIQARPTGKFVVWDSANIVEATGNSIRSQGVSFVNMLSISNVANNSSAVRGGTGTLAIGGGPSANSWTAVNQGMTAAVAFNQFLGVGQPNTVAALGNVTLTGAAGSAAQGFVYAGSNVGNLGGVLSQISVAGNVTTALGVTTWFQGTPTTTPTNVYGFYMPGTTNLYGAASTNGMRTAANYYFLRNDDAVAQTQLGSLRSYNEVRFTAGTSGTFSLDKTNAQVQYIVPTGVVNISGYDNMVTSLTRGAITDYEIDTLTVIVQQGATPYAVNLPAGSTYVYANGVNTIPAVANSTTVFTVVAYENSGSTSYYTTVSSTEPTLSLTGNITGGNILTAGVVSATGNITGSYILGNGSQLTGLPATYSNANVTTFLASFGSNTVSTTGNVTAGYFVGNGSLLTGITTSYNDSNVTTLLASFGSNTISTSGNITGGNIIGAGTYLTGINAFGNVAVAGQTTVSADTTTDTLTLVAGTNITITTDAANNKVTITSSGSGGTGETISPLLLMGG